jgi:ATP-dependent DNA ligase
MECVILGYLAHENGQVHTLLLGTEIYGKLAYAGSVYPKLNEAQLIDLSENLGAIKRSRPLLRLQSADAVWVEPKFVCSVSYTNQEPNGRLTEIAWDDLVGQLRL